MSNVYPGASGDRRLDSTYSEHDDRVVSFNPTRGPTSYIPRYRGSQTNYRRGGQTYHPSESMRKYGNKAKHNRKSQNRGKYSRNNRGGPSSTFSDDEEMGDVSQNRRYSPYHGVSHNTSRFKHRQPTGPRHRDMMSIKTEKYNKLFGGPDAWFKVTIPHGSKDTEHNLLSNLLSITDVPFVPHEYHTEGSNAVFYVQGSQAASALKNCSRRTTNAHGFKIVVIVNPSEAPLTEKITPEITAKLKICMSNRYDPSTRSLNLSALEKDADLNKENIRLALGKPMAMKEVFNIIEENIPELEGLDISDNKLGSLVTLEKYFPAKSPNVVRLSLANNTIRTMTEVYRLCKAPLTELVLSGNPLCDNYNNNNNYVSAIRKKFPKLVKLDGQDLPPVITFELSKPVAIPESKGSFLGSNEQVQATITQFVQQYFTVYDSLDRFDLREAYIDEAVFSLVCGRIDSMSTNRVSSLNNYLDKSHNLLRSTPGTSSRMKCGRSSVVLLHNELPRTEHDMSSFLVDVHLLSHTMLIFSVQGVFREPESHSNPDRQALRSFNRMFIVVPKGPGMAIANEQYTVNNATPDQVKKAFRTPVVQAKTLTDAEKEVMTINFSKQSGMNTDWSRRCLEDNNWNFEAAAKVFTDLKTKGQIPPEAFVPIQPTA